MTPPNIAYPCDVAAEFIRRERATWLRLHGKSYFGESFEGEPERPTEDEIKQLVETMFFVSQATEEGHFGRVGIVFFGEEPDREFASRWNLIRFRERRDFDVASITKYASACGTSDALFAIVSDSQQLKIVGIATPPELRFPKPNVPVQVIALKPGDISIRRGSEEIVRYQRGNVLPRWPSVYSHASGYPTHRIAQLNDIQQTVFGNPIEPAYTPSVFSGLTPIIRGMVGRAHGGLLVILGPNDELNDILDSPMQLAEPLKLGEALRRMDNALALQGAISQERFDVIERVYADGPEGYSQQLEQERADEEAQLSTNTVSQMIERITDFTTVDGAVVLNHRLDVLAFGVKLTAGAIGDAEVKTIDLEGRPGESFPLSIRGTRHRAAAAFAKAHNQGLSVIVSQDGDAAIFVASSPELFEAHSPECVVRWPLAI